MRLLKRTGRGKRQAGQTSLEVIGIAVVLVVLLLLVLVTTYSRNMETQRILETSENSIQCSEMSATIARVYSNRATTYEALHLATGADLNRVEGKPGRIKVGKVSCSYIGGVEKSTGELDTDPDGAGTVGIALGFGNWCFEKQPDTNVVVGQGECD